MLDQEACSLAMYRVLVPDILAGEYVGFGMSPRRLAYLASLYMYMYALHLSGFASLAVCLCLRPRCRYYRVSHKRSASPTNTMEDRVPSSGTRADIQGHDPTRVSPEWPAMPASTRRPITPSTRRCALVPRPRTGISINGVHVVHT